MPKIGRALKSVVEIVPQGRYADRARARPSSPLMNANRRRIFQHLCLNPCSGIGAIASGTGISRSSVSWHLEQLVSSGYTERLQYGRSRVFAPVGMVQEHSIRALSVLAKGNCRSIFDSILESPGSDVKALLGGLDSTEGRLRTCLKELTDSELVVRLMDGRYARYFPAERFRDIALEMRAKSKGFTRRLMVKLAEEHLKPEIRDMKRGNTVIVLTVLGQETVLEIPRRPLPDA